MVDFKVERIEKEVERDIIIGLITSENYVKKIRRMINFDFFEQPFLRTISEWCIEYYDKYEKVPGKEIKSLFESKKDFLFDKNKIELIESFLVSINEKFIDNYEFNVEFNVDKTEKFFKNAALNKLIEKIKSSQLLGNFEKADFEIANYKKIEKNVVSGIDIWTDLEANLEALRSNDNDNILFGFPGDLGKLVRPFKRKEFICFVGPSKRSKTWWLIEMGVLASIQNLNVLFISLEMTGDQALLRIHQRITGMLEPDYNDDRDYIDLFIPKFDRQGEVYQQKESRKRMDPNIVIKQIKSMSYFTNNKFKLVYSPAGSVKASDIKLMLTNYNHYEEFIPDVILVDYPDILAPEFRNETRHQIDETWKILRSISQEWNCLVCVVSHSNKATYDRDIRQGDLSEDSRKLNHVTWAAAINQNDTDRENNTIRLSIIADRFKRFNPNDEVLLTQCLDIGAVYLESKLIKKG